MTLARRIASLVPAAVLAASCFAAVTVTPSAAMAADEGSRVESIAAKGHISPVVPVECGLGFGLFAALLAVGMDRRARRVEAPASWPTRAPRATTVRA